MVGNDSFIDDEDDTCPLCIEEFDLSDRNFKPCPCGYQVCQFCFNNIKSNMNGLCPACRRPYDEKTIEWKVVTAEEVAEFKADIQKNRKKRAQEQRLKEAQQRQAEKNDRKNLVGVRVVQKNLVYVTGVTPSAREDELMDTLRKPEYFGQYGKIQKISISNRKGSDGHSQSLGIYVTFEKNEDAAKCIQAVNGALNNDRVLRAQFGTTKYCSAWLRHEQCTNRQCMFLHEQGDDEDSYTRQDLSSINSIDSQRRQAIAGSSRSASRQKGPPVQQPPITSSQPMARSSSKDGSDVGDSSALPSSANWARNPQRSRRGSHATSGAADSPAISTSLPATAEGAVAEPPQAASSKEPKKSESPAQAAAAVAAAAKKREETQKEAMDWLVADFLTALKTLKLKEFTYEDIKDYPPLFDPRGGAKRRAMREAEKVESITEESADAQEASDGEPETGGSLALGGEPEDRDPVRDFESRRAPGAQLSAIPKSIGEGIFGSSLNNFGPGSSSAVGSIGNRTATPHQQQHQLYGSMRPGGVGSFESGPPGIGAQASGFQQGHQRGSSRYNFTNDGTSSANAVKVAANPRVMAQQASMMPQPQHSHHGGQLYGISMPGPPPGLKSSGTPPNPFHSYSSGSGLGTKESDMLHMMRRGGASGAAQEKLDLADPSILQVRMQHQQQSNAGVGQGPFGGQSQGGYNPSMMYNPGFSRW